MTYIVNGRKFIHSHKKWVDV